MNEFSWSSFGWLVKYNGILSVDHSPGRISAPPRFPIRVFTYLGRLAAAKCLAVFDNDL
jgi:hypothetical protein